MVKSHMLYAYGSDPEDSEILMWEGGGLLQHSPIGISNILALDVSTKSLFVVAGGKVEFVEADIGR